MSLTTERLAIESKIASFEKERAILDVKADMQIATVRQEASPLLELSQIDTSRLVIAVEELHGYAERAKEIEAEIARLKKML